MTGAPQFFELSREECAEILARNHVGRLAYRHGRHIHIQPLGFVAQDDVLFLRSSYGTKMDALARDPFVAFEVDEIQGPFDWRSVVVHGTIYVVERDGGAAERRAVEAIRSVMPTAFTDKDPAPDRQILYGLYVHEVSGRMAQSVPVPTGRVRVTPGSTPAVDKPADRF
jgi:nitroimidazol reductase NimA-like FMN-containing flavoprotein (pyridoxamine 5'-phosphate oxidase superfamily)